MTVSDNEEYVTIEGYENDRVPLRVKVELDKACAAVDAAKERREAARDEFNKYAGRTLTTVKYEAEQEARHEEYIAQRRTSSTYQKMREKLKSNRFKIDATSFRPGDVVWINTDEDLAPARITSVNYDNLIARGEVHLQHAPGTHGMVYPVSKLGHASASNPRVQDVIQRFEERGLSAKARG